MAEINKDEQIQILPVLTPSHNGLQYRTYTITVEPATKFYRITNMMMQALGLLSLAAWFILLIALLGISFSVLNNLESVNVIRSQNVVSAEDFQNSQ
jgi:cytochrome c biogenesis protein ResB